MTNNYNFLAPYYNFLSSLVFGNRLKKAQKEYLHLIPSYSSVLIVGGGDGWILEEISRLTSENLSITYIDKSTRMIELAQKKIQKNEVIFLNEAIEDSEIDKSFDIIITPFLFDNFTYKKSVLVFKNLNNSLKNKGLWLYVDFRNEHFLHQLLLDIMYQFFKLFANIESQKLCALNKLFESEYIPLKENFSMGRMIHSIVYKKEKRSNF